MLDRRSTPPGGPVSASGQGCDPNSTVDLSIGSSPVGSTVADGSGAFQTPITVSQPVGQFQVVAVCGPTLTATLDVVLTSTGGPPTTTAAVLLILLLIVLVAIKWQLFNR